MDQDSAGNGTDPATRHTRAGPLGFLRPAARDRPQLTLAGPESSEAPPPPVRSRRRRRGLSSFAWLAVVPAGVLAAVLIVHANQAAKTAPIAPPSNQVLVVASVPYWSIGPGTDTVLAHRNDVNEVSPWMYGIGGNGQIILDSGISKSTIEVYLNRLRARGLPLVPTLANVDAQGNWSYGPVARMLHNPAMAARQVAEIVALVDSNHYAGIDLDYENLRAGDRQAFTAFVTRLASALHAKGKILSVALFAKTTNAGYAPRNVAQDYAAIGRVADQVRLMTYDYHWATSPPGPDRPDRLGPRRDQVRQDADSRIEARSRYPAVRLRLDQSPRHCDQLAAGDPVVPALSRPAALHASSQAPSLTYTDASGRKHVVWFENAESSRAKLDVAHGAGIGGVYLWMYGTADPGTWPALRQVFRLGSHPAHSSQRGAS
jgi:spore germination protein